MPKLTTKSRGVLSAHEFAFQAQRKEPIENASHVRNAMARFDQVSGVTDAERDIAWGRILAAAKVHGVVVQRADWRERADHPIRTTRR